MSLWQMLFKGLVNLPDYLLLLVALISVWIDGRKTYLFYIGTFHTFVPKEKSLLSESIKFRLGNLFSNYSKVLPTRLDYL